MRTNSSIKENVRNILFHFLNKKFLTFFFFVCLSTIFWFISTLNDRFNQDFEVPIRIVNVPENVVITTDLPENLHLTLTDKGFSLIGLKYLGFNNPIIVDFNKYNNSNGHVTINANDLLKQVIAEIPSSATISHIRPQFLEYYFNYGERKKVPIKINGKINCEQQYYIDNIVTIPDSITVFAASPILDTLTHAYTQHLYYNNLSKTTKIVTSFQKIKGVKYSPDSVTINVNIDKLTEKRIEVAVHPINFPQDRKLRTFPAKVEVKFQVGIHAYNSITAENFIIPIDYEEIKNDKQKKFHLQLKSIPKGVRYVRISPQDVDFVIENIPDLTPNNE